jgi:flagellar hook-associated protein 2
MTAPIRASGLASGIDTQSMIDQLVSLERRPIDLLQARQRAYRKQISKLGSIASKLSALEDAAKDLASKGVRSASVQSTHTAFSATAALGAATGRWSVRVTALASAAKARSAAFTAATDAVDTGTLTLSIDGTDYVITKAAGDTLADIATKIQQSGAPVTATILSDGTSSYLSVTRSETGYQVGQPASSALQITETNDGTGAPAVGLSITQSATNATLEVDGLAIERRSNTISDVLPGITLNLSQTMTSAETLVVADDTKATADRVRTFVEAYQAVNDLVHEELAVSPDTDREASLAGDGTLRSLQRALHSVISTSVAGLGSVRALVDIGVHSDRDGNLLLDEDQLAKALQSDPGAVDRIFSEASVGIGDRISALTKTYTDPIDGILITRQDGLNDSIHRADDAIAKLELRVDSFEANLVKQFTAMEQVVGQLKSMGAFLTSNLGG